MRSYLRAIGGPTSINDMLITLTIASIFAVTGLVVLVNRRLPVSLGGKKITPCAFCAGVSLTWLWLVIARSAGVAIDPLIPAILMGGSVVGLSYLVEKKLSSNRQPLYWKLSFVPVGFLAIYAFLTYRWWLVALSLIVMLAVFLFFTRRTHHEPTHDAKIKDLEKEMEKCC